MADLTISIGIDAKGTKKGADDAKSALRGVRDEAGKLSGVNFAEIGKKLTAAGNQLKQIGGSIQSAGSALTIGITAPLTALATLGVRSALELDKARTKLTALVGSAEEANKKIAELRELADSSVGVTRAAAIETFSQLKGIGGVAEESINRMIVAMGKLNAAFNIDDQAGFMRNLTQIFSQGFERADVKEAIGRVPFFEQLLEQAFGTSDPEKLNALKAAGTLTMDTFMSGLAEAIQNDQRVANIGENLTTKMAKAFERMNDALAPLGDVILEIVVPAIEAVAPYIDKLGKWFADLSPEAKTAAVAVAAVAAAIGPLLFILGSIVIAIGGFVTALGTIAASAGTVGIAILAVIGVIGQMAIPLALIATEVYILYKAWETNFAGIRDFTSEVATAIQNAWNAALTEISSFTQSLLAQINEFWLKHGEEIKEALAIIEAAIREKLEAIRAFWNEHGGQITEIVTTIWNAIKVTVKLGLDIILQVIRAVAALIRGDWKSFWDATAQIIKDIIVIWVNLLLGAVDLVVKAVRAIFIGIFTLKAWIDAEAFALGKTLALGLIKGILSMQFAVVDAAVDVVRRAINAMKSEAQTQSLSKVTTEIGKNIADGLAVGMDSGAGEVAKSARDLSGVIEGIFGYEPFIDAPTRIEGMNYNTGGSYFTPPPENVVRAAKSVGAARAAAPPRIELTADQKQAEQLQRTIADLKTEIEFFGKTTEVSKVAQQLFTTGLFETNKALAEQAVVVAKTLDGMKAKAEADKKAVEFQKELAAITAGGRDQRTGLEGTLAELNQQIALGRELTDVERTLIENKQALILLQHQMEDAKKSDEEISKAVQELRVQQNLTLEIQKQIQAKREQIAAEQAYKNLIGGLDSEILDLTIQLQEYTTGIETSRVAILQLTEAYKQLTPEQQKAASQKAAEIDGLRESIKAQEEARRAYDEMYGTIRDSLQVLSEQGFGAFFKNVYRKFKDFLLDMVTEWITSKFFQMFFKGGNQQQAQAGGSAGGIFGGILNGIFGGGQGGGIPGIGPGGTGGFNPGGFNRSTGDFSALGGFNIGSIFGGGNRTGIGGHEGAHAGGRSGGGLAGALGLAGAGASILGGAIGGRVGGFISNIGTGVALGAQIGSIIPGIGTAIGAVVGGAVGFFASLFGGDPKRKRDKNEKIPALNKGFTDALKELRDLVGDVRTLRVSPDSAIARATELRNQIAAGFGLEFESKKYRKQARTLITQRTREADALIAELRNAAEIANAAGERQRRLIPEFATGVFMSRDFTKQLGDFKRRNGMMAGRYSGIDSINARIGAGEMVLNPRQQQNVRSNAGLDPFRNAGIPGYAGGGAVGGGQSAVGSAEPMNMTFVFEHSIDADGMVRTSLKNNPDVKREVRVVVEDLAENDRLKLKRRGL